MFDRNFECLGMRIGADLNVTVVDGPLTCRLTNAFAKAGVRQQRVCCLGNDFWSARRSHQSRHAMGYGFPNPTNVDGHHWKPKGHGFLHNCGDSL
jgi:hypothetical protein